VLTAQLKSGMLNLNDGDHSLMSFTVVDDRQLSSFKKLLKGSTNL